MQSCSLYIYGVEMLGIKICIYANVVDGAKEFQNVISQMCTP